ncbi:MAG: helix-turn-helix domain-containing protein [Clostridia bacterium]|nr:helix-turn-helix domain-containing protein [Clostridia bacterium]
MKQEILNELIPITEEERAILDGAGVDKSIYTTHGGSVIRHKKLLSDGRLIRVRAHTRFVHFPEHTHDYIEAVYMCSGETTHIINGKELILKEGELLFLGQNARQEILPAGEGDIAVNFIIQPLFFDKTLEMLGAEETPIKSFLLRSLLDGVNQGYLHFKVSGVLPVQNLIENLIWTLIHNTSNKRNINQTTMGLLFMQLLNHTDRLAYESREDRAIMEILRYIEGNYKDGSLTEAARLLHYDFYWLSHEIKNRTGKTYTDHLQEKRLSQAAFLLKNTGLSVEEIALAVGYENKSYFHRIFTARYGTSPRKYRTNISE